MVSQTDRNFGIRATEHFKSIIKGEGITHFSAHGIENNHTFSKAQLISFIPVGKVFALISLNILK